MPETKIITQVSCGGVAFRHRDSVTEVALISVGEQKRWQLPKGQLNTGESNEAAAQREVREETGLETEFVSPIDTISYWFAINNNGQRARVHKFVHFFLFRYISGDTADHDHEVNEARWFEINEAIALLNFESEKAILRRAQELLAQPHPNDEEQTQ